MRLQRILAYTTAALLAAQVLIVLWGVITRKIFNAPATWTGEMASYLLIWIALLGAAYASSHQAHISIELLPQRLEPEKRRRLYRLIDSLVLLFALLVMVIGGGYYVYMTLLLGQRAPGLGIPKGLIYIVAPLAGLCIIYFKQKDIRHGRV